MTPDWTPDRPFNALPLLPPQADIETRPVLKQCVAARAALAELKQAAELIPNPEILIQTLPLLEALASSEIENIVTTTDRLFRELPESATADPATRQALRYRHALMEAFGQLRDRPLTTRLAEEVCSRILGRETHVRRVPGTTLRNTATGETVYTPPDGEDRLRSILRNWEEFIHGEDDLDPLVRMAVAHYQFEAVHPFTDGNGRTGRILNSLLLVERRLLPLPILYLSRHIIATKPDYYRLLLEVTRDGAWEPWIVYVLQGVEATSTWTTGKIGEIRALAEETVARVREELPKIYSRELVDVILERPYCRIANVVERGIAKRETASRYLKALVAIGVLREEVAGRERLFINDRLMALLTH